MDTNDALSSQMMVDELLRLHPEAWVVFKIHQMDCLGCFMQRFCTLQEAAEVHQLSIQELMDDLSKQIQSNAKGAFNENLGQTF